MSCRSTERHFNPWIKSGNIFGSRYIGVDLDLSWDNARFSSANQKASLEENPLVMHNVIWSELSLPLSSDMFQQPADLLCTKRRTNNVGSFSFNKLHLLLQSLYIWANDSPSDYCCRIPFHFPFQKTTKYAICQHSEILLKTFGHGFWRPSKPAPCIVKTPLLASQATKKKKKTRAEQNMTSLLNNLK